MTDTLSRNLFISIGGHLALVLVIFFQAVMIPHDPLELRTAIRVDVVGLPDKIQELTPKEEAKPEPAAPAPKLPPKETMVEPKPKAPQMPNTKEKKTDFSKSQKQALNKLKSLEALEKIKSQVSEGTGKAKPTQVIKGQAINEGNSLTGLEKIDFDRYLQDVKDRILNQWSIPEWMADAKLKAQVLVLIDERGYVTRKIFRKSSGNIVFDDTVKSAIDAASPLPAPPKRLQSQLATSGIIFNFPESQ
jgi:colicin import membrane protein